MVTFCIVATKCISALPNGAYTTLKLPKRDSQLYVGGYKGTKKDQRLFNEDEYSSEIIDLTI